MKILKYTKYLQYIMVFLTICLFSLFMIGCGSSPSSQLNRALTKMNDEVGSYSFKGSAIIDMGDIQGSGDINYAGYYRAPGETYMKLDMGIMDQSQNLELYIDPKGKIFTRPAGTEWMPYLAPPNLSNFQQPGQNQNAVQIIKNLGLIMENINSAGMENIDGKEVSVITASANPNKLKSLISRQLTETSRSSEDEKELIRSLVKDMNIVQEYTVYVDPETDYVLRLNLKQETRLKIQEQEALISSEMTFNYSGFDLPVEMPEINNR